MSLTTVNQGNYTLLQESLSLLGKNGICSQSLQSTEEIARKICANATPQLLITVAETDERPKLSIWDDGSLYKEKEEGKCYKVGFRQGQGAIFTPQLVSGRNVLRAVGGTLINYLKIKGDGIEGPEQDKETPKLSANKEERLKLNRLSARRWSSFIRHSLVG